MEKKNNWLFDYRNKIKSQFGEDGVITKIFEVIGETNKWCVEFGAGNGEQNSNSWNLINKDWSAVLIEADKSEFAALEKLYGGNKNVALFCDLVAESGEYSLDNILKKTKIPKTPDFLSIDIDGYDYHVWKSLSEYEPRVVMIECNGTIPPDIDFVQPKNIDVASGSSFAAMVHLGKEKGYELVYARAVNAIFVKKELFHLFGIQNNSILSMLDDFLPKRYFQLFDSSIVLLGENSSRMFRKKKISSAPIWTLSGGNIVPVKLNFQKKSARFFKDYLKAAPFYPSLRTLYPRVKSFKKKFWQDKN